ncbi:MAG: hypothetical protein ACREBS_05755 [Nitrososphaerales archaeon]
MSVSEAKEVSIELSKINWELLDLTYRFEWGDPEWAKGKKGENEESLRERTKSVQKWEVRKLQHLSSITRRVKYEALLGRVVTKGHIGKVGFRSVYDMDPSEGLDVNYEVLSTKPEGEVRVTEQTELTIRESDRNW